MIPYFSNEHGRLYCCDYFKADLQIQCALMLTDPPYGVTSQEWDVAPDWSVFFNTARRFIKPSAAIVFTMTQPETSRAVIANFEAFRWAYIWLKNKATGHLDADARPMRTHEDILVFCDQQPLYNPQPIWNQNIASHAVNRGVTNCYGGQREGSIYQGSHIRKPKTAIYEPETTIECAVVNNDDPERIHANQKPVPLFEYLMKTFSNENDIVFDPFAGSGTTAFAAQNCGRKWMLFEADEAKCEKMANRLEGYFPHLDPEGQEGWESFIEVQS